MGALRVAHADRKALLKYVGELIAERDTARRAMNSLSAYKAESDAVRVGAAALREERDEALRWKPKFIPLSVRAGAATPEEWLAQGERYVEGIQKQRDEWFDRCERLRELLAAECTRAEEREIERVPVWKGCSVIAESLRCNVCGAKVKASQSPNVRDMKHDPRCSTGSRLLAMWAALA